MKKIALAILVAILSITLFSYRFEVLQFVQELEHTSMDNPIVASGILIALKAISAPLGFPGTPLTLLSGSLFGNFLGTIIALIGNTIGASLAFLLSRYVFRDYVQEKFVSRYPNIKKYEERLEEKALSTVIALRLIPLFPFNALNFLFGVTNVSFKEYVIGSFIGMIPGTFLFVYFGESLRMLSIVNVFFAIVGIALLTYLGKIYEKRW